jgi:hypothetical protein
MCVSEREGGREGENLCVGTGKTRATSRREEEVTVSITVSVTISVTVPRDIAALLFAFPFLLGYR